MRIGATRHRRKHRKSTITSSGDKHKILLSEKKREGHFFETDGLPVTCVIVVGKQSCQHVVHQK